MLLFYTVPINEENKNKAIENALEGIALGDTNQIKALYELTDKAIFTYALSFLKNGYDAEDVMHDSYIKIFQSASSYTPLGKPMAWILTIVKNLCLQKIKENSKVADSQKYDDELFKDNLALDEENKFIIKSCLNSLKDDEREIVLLHIVAGLKHKEIAQYKKMLLSTVLSKYNRALKKLKTIIETELTQNE